MGLGGDAGFAKDGRVWVDGPYGVVEGTGVGAGEGRLYIGYGPVPLKSLRTFTSNSRNALGSMLSCHSR